MEENPLTFNQTALGISEFIFQSRHPALNEYISGVVRAVADELAVGNVEKVVVLIKGKDDVALERYIFAVQNVIQVEAYNKDTSVQGAMTPSALGQYLRAFMVKLSMMENQLGQLSLGGDGSFAVIIELQDDKVPSISQGKNPPPWVPATTSHTTRGVANQAELHMVRAMDTGIINLSLAVQESEAKLIVQKEQNSKGKQRAV